MENQSTTLLEVFSVSFWEWSIWFAFSKNSIHQVSHAEQVKQNILFFRHPLQVREKLIAVFIEKFYSVAWERNDLENREPIYVFCNLLFFRCIEFWYKERVDHNNNEIASASSKLTTNLLEQIKTVLDFKSRQCKTPDVFGFFCPEGNGNSRKFVELSFLMTESQQKTE